VPSPRANCSEVIPSLKAEGNLRPEIRWKLRSPVVLVSAVDLDTAEKRFRKAAAPAGVKLLRVVICCCDEGGTDRTSAVSLPTSWSAPPFCLCLCLLIRNRITANISAAPARLPMTVPTVLGVLRGGILLDVAPARAALVEAGGGEVAAGFAPPPPPPLNTVDAVGVGTVKSIELDAEVCVADDCVDWLEDCEVVEFDESDADEDDNDETDVVEVLL
jgi:hypothetical protein